MSTLQRTSITMGSYIEIVVDTISMTHIRVKALWTRHMFQWVPWIMLRHISYLRKLYPKNVAELLMVEKQILKKISESTNWYIVAQYKEMVNAIDFLSI